MIPSPPTQAEEWQFICRCLGISGADRGPAIPKIIHRFWTGGPMREGAFQYLLASAEARAHGWALFLWRSRDIEDAWDQGALPRLRDEDRALRERQREALRGAGYAIRDVEELSSPEAARPLPEAQARQIREAARFAAERPDDGEPCVNIKCFSDIARLLYLRAHGGLHLDVDIGLGDMELDAAYYHNDPQGLVPLLGALGRDTYTNAETAAALSAAREARRAGVLDEERVRSLAERATLVARAYNAVIATQPGTPHLDLALRALLDELGKSAHGLPSGMGVQRVLLCGLCEEDAALEGAVKLAVPSYLTRLDQLTRESDWDVGATE